MKMFGALALAVVVSGSSAGMSSALGASDHVDVSVATPHTEKPTLSWCMWALDWAFQDWIDLCMMDWR